MSDIAETIQEPLEQAGKMQYQFQGGPVCSINSYIYGALQC